MSLVRRLKQKGVLCGTEYIDKRFDSRMITVAQIQKKNNFIYKNTRDR